MYYKQLVLKKVSQSQQYITRSSPSHVLNCFHYQYQCITSKALFEEIQSSFKNVKSNTYKQQSRKQPQTKPKNKYQKNKHSSSTTATTANATALIPHSNRDVQQNNSTSKSIFSQFNSQNYPILASAMGEDSFGLQRIDRLSSSDSSSSSSNISQSRKQRRATIQDIHVKHRTKNQDYKQQKKSILAASFEHNEQFEKNQLFKQLDFYDLPMNEVITPQNLLITDEQKSHKHKHKQQQNEENERNNSNYLENNSNSSFLQLLNTNNTLANAEQNSFDRHSNYSDSDSVSVLSDPKSVSIYHPQYSNITAADTSDMDAVYSKSKKEIIKDIDWTKLENYIQVNDNWNEFALFLNSTNTNSVTPKPKPKSALEKHKHKPDKDKLGSNDIIKIEKENEKEKEAYLIPGFYQHQPMRRHTRDRPKAVKFQSVDQALKVYHISQQIQMEVVFINKLNGDINILINNLHFGFVKKLNLHFNVKIGEYHTGYIQDVNSRALIECVFEKPNFWSRMNDCQHRIISLLKYSNGVLFLNDKSVDSATIEGLFQMSRKNFKKAIGMLFKEKVIGIDKSLDNPKIWLMPQYLLKSIRNNETRSREESSAASTENEDGTNHIFANATKEYDIAGGIEQRMWQSKPIWEYGHTSPSYGTLLPQQVRNRQKYQAKKHDRRQQLRKRTVA